MLEIATPVCALARNDISGSAFENLPGLSLRVERSGIEESSGLTMVMSFLGPLLEGAVTEGDWGSVLSSEVHSLRHGLRRATSLSEGGK